MLKRKRMINTCSLSSCRIKAEALARVFNSRIWPCTWVDRRRTEDSAEEDEEYFEASPIEDEDEDRGRDSSAASAEGRAKLYQLLQQHANDDATEVFYDVSEHVESDGGNVSRTVVQEDGFEEIQLNDSGGVISENVTATGDLINSNEVLQCEAMPSESASENSSPVVETRSYFDGDKSVEVIREEPKGSSFEKDVLALKRNADPYEPNEIEIYPNYANDFLNEEHKNTEANVPLNSAETSECDMRDIDISLCNTEQENLISDSENKTLNGFEFEEEEILTVSLDSESSTVNQTEFSDTKLADLPSESNISAEDHSQNFDATTDQENDPEDTDNSIFIQITKICSSPPGKDEQTNSNGHVSKIDADLQDSCRLHVFTGTRPTISRSTSLKTGKTPPGTPSRKKIVRFADVLGLDLEDVRHIISGDLPNIPSSAFSDLVLHDEDLPLKCTPSTTLELTGIQQGSWENVQQGAAGLNVIYPLFDIPGQQHDFVDRVRNVGICLENIIISDFNVQCTCRVMNWGFSKKVVARYTMDGWKSSQDINASYISDSSRDGMDSFAFNIFLPQQRCNVEFALLYSVNDRDYWDNNRGKNYCLGYHSNGSIGHSTVPTSPTWMHQFW